MALSEPPRLSDKIPQAQKQMGNTHESRVKTVLNSSNKAEALKSVDSLPSNIQAKTKSFFKGGSNSYTDFSVEIMDNGNYMAKMTKAGDVSGSKAIYYKEITPSGDTMRVFKEPFGPAGNLVHIKEK